MRYPRYAGAIDPRRARVEGDDSRQGIGIGIGIGIGEGSYTVGDAGWSGVRVGRPLPPKRRNCNG